MDVITTQFVFTANASVDPALPATEKHVEPVSKPNLCLKGPYSVNVFKALKRLSFSGRIVKDINCVFFT